MDDVAVRVATRRKVDGAGGRSGSCRAGLHVGNSFHETDDRPASADFAVTGPEDRRSRRSTRAESSGTSTPRWP